MKKILIPLAAAAALSLSPAYAQGTLGLGKDKPAADAPGVATSKDGATRDLKTPVGTVSTEVSNEALGASATVGTEKSPKVKAGARVAKGAKDKGSPISATGKAAVVGPNADDNDSTGDRAKNAGDKLVPESAK